MAFDKHSIKLIILASGSKGNAAYISDQKTSLLVDAGLSGREIERRLAVRNIKPDSLDAILVTHEHRDHIQGAGVLSRRYDLPVYINKKTAAAAGIMGRVDHLENFKCGTSFQIKSLTIHPFSISHDAVDPSGFTISSNGTKIGIATDLGIATAVVKLHLADCSGLVVEANHDPTMLIQGPYPWDLKQRVRSRHGHLSNQDTGELLQELTHAGLSHVILAHLSEINNTPQKALEAVNKVVDKIKLSVAAQDQVSANFIFRSAK